MKMKTYPQRARAAALREIEDAGGTKTFGVSTEDNTLDVLRRMKDEGMLEEPSDATHETGSTYRVAHINSDHSAAEQETTQQAGQSAKDEEHADNGRP